MTTPFVHPLFDLSSPYRLASQESIWSDHGERSIKRYFLALHRQMLRDQWDDPIRKPEKEPEADWRYSPRINELLHKFYRRAYADIPQEQPYKPKVVKSESAETIPYADAELFPPTPALLFFDLSQPGTPHLRGPYRPDRTALPDQWLGWFTGIDDANHSLESTEEEFEIRIPNQEEGRFCLALLMPLLLIRQLAELLGGQRKLNWDDHEEEPAVETIRDVLSPERLARPAAEDNVERFADTCRLASVLALAPGLEQKINGGIFKPKVTWKEKCPAIPSGSWVVFCVGPRAEEVEGLS